MVDVANEAIENLDFLYPFSLAVLYHLMDKDFSIKVIILLRSAQTGRHIALPKQAIFQCFRLFPCGFKLCIQGQDLSLQRFCSCWYFWESIEKFRAVMTSAVLSSYIRAIRLSSSARRFSARFFSAAARLCFASCPLLEGFKRRAAMAFSF